MADTVTVLPVADVNRPLAPTTLTAKEVVFDTTLPVVVLSCLTTGVATSRADANDATFSDLVTAVPAVLVVITIKSLFATVFAAVKAVILGIIY